MPLSWELASRCSHFPHLSSLGNTPKHTMIHEAAKSSVLILKTLICAPSQSSPIQMQSSNSQHVMCTNDVVQGRWDRPVNQDIRVYVIKISKQRLTCKCKRMTFKQRWPCKSSKVFYRANIKIYHLEAHAFVVRTRSPDRGQSANAMGPNVPLHSAVKRTLNQRVDRDCLECFRIQANSLSARLTSKLDERFESSWQVGLRLYMIVFDGCKHVHHQPGTFSGRMQSDFGLCIGVSW